MQLAPTEIKYQRGLMMYYLHAPRFVGGGKVKARNIADLDKKAGLIAQIDIAGKTENEDELDQLMQIALDKYPTDNEVNLRASFAYQQQQKFASALNHFQTVFDSEQIDRVAKYQARYQIGRTVLLSKQNLRLRIAALQEYIDNHSKSRELPEKHWAQFHLANLLELKDKEAQAKKIYASLRRLKDKELQEQLGEKT